MNIFKKFKAYLRMQKAISMADNAHKATGNRYYVLPTFDKSRKLIVLDRKNFRILKHKHYIKSNAKVYDIIRESFYFTPYADGRGVISEEGFKVRMQNYYNWYKSQS